MVKLLRNVTKAVTTRGISRASKKLHADKDAAPKFIHQVGVQDNPTQRVTFSSVERSLYSSILGDLTKQQDLYAGQRRLLNWGKYVENHDSPDFVQPLSKASDRQPSNMPVDVMRVPYPQSSVESAYMRAALELIRTSGFFVAASVGEGMQESYRREIVERHVNSCLEVNVKSLVLKPVLFRACLWNLSSAESELDDYWTKGYIDSHLDVLGSKLQTPDRPTVKNRDERGTIVVYFFELHKDSHLVLEDVFESMQDICRFLGARIGPEAIGGSQHLKETLSNINAPWVSTGDENTKSLAKVLEGLASLGLVDSSKAPGGGIYVV